MFRDNDITYCNGSYQFGIELHDDPRILSGDIAASVSAYAAKQERPLCGPLVFLVNDSELVEPLIRHTPQGIEPAPPGGWQIHRFDNETSSPTS